MKNILQFINELSKYNFKEINIDDDIIDYSLNFPYVHDEEFVRKFMRKVFDEKI